MPAVEYSKKFITSVVLGKDVVPRIGLYQMEALRADLINAIQRSIDPERDSARSASTHPADSTIALTIHQPLYPPGRIIHIIRHHPKADENVLKSRDPVYQAIWADNIDFDEVLISPVMLICQIKYLSAFKKGCNYKWTA
ncbi:hypothetical protein DOY81_014160 [Sarcophaga bullata]|nr:hypothetical protein DOY81_014160 [Sarcophaga bullata]